MRRSFQAAAIGIALLALGGHAASAAEGDGTWRCFANGNIPIGTLNIAGNNYDFVVTKASDFSTVKQGDPGNGAGTLAWRQGGFIPESGPLKTAYAVTGAMDPAGIYLNDADGGMMLCRRHDG